MQQMILPWLSVVLLLVYAVVIVARFRRKRAKNTASRRPPKKGNQQQAKDGKIAERFVSQHCEATFLRLWGIANPIGKDQRKELCDYLVVCDPDIIIISAKDIALPDNANSIERERWRRKAIKKSVESIYGAERILRTLDEIRTPSGRALKLPTVADRQFHRICIAFGSRREIPISAGNFGKGFVHVLEEVTVPILLRELDTISDFTSYLTAKEKLIERGCAVVGSGEEGLLALYLHNGRSFPARYDRIVVDETLWDDLSKDPTYLAGREANKNSYAWDNVIEYVTKGLIAGDLLFSDPAGDEEKVLRTMAREPRFYRRYLGESLTEVLMSEKIRARIIQSQSSVVYVIAAFSRAEDRLSRKAELTARCYVARSRFKDEACKVVGIASERASDGKPGLSFDLMMIDVPVWTAELHAQAEKAKNELGFFKDPEQSTRHHEEYPATKSTP